MPLYPDQVALKQAVYSEWAKENHNVVMVAPTGAGKTRTFCDIVSEQQDRVWLLAHRQDLVIQISETLGHYGLHHHAVVPHKVTKEIIKLNNETFGKNFCIPSANRIIIASVDTVNSRKHKPEVQKFLPGTALVVPDEGHHVLKANKWGKMLDLFEHTRSYRNKQVPARVLLPTATPERGDGKGLGVHAHGVAHSLVQGLNLRQLINRGRLCDYVIHTPYSKDLDLNIPVSASTGDYVKAEQIKAIRQSNEIVGDVVRDYLRYARGKTGLTFVTDIATGERITAAYNAAGVPAMILHKDTPTDVRGAIRRDLKSGKIKQVVSVDVIGEGYDVPAVEVVSLVRKTKSFAVFFQQVGRGLRFIAGKTLIIIDHVGNCLEHAVARHDEETGRLVIDLCYKNWSLDGRNKSKKQQDDQETPLTTCENPIPLPDGLLCTATYPKIYKTCPYCGYTKIPVLRESPEEVDGDLTELTPQAMWLLQQQIDHFDRDPEIYRHELQQKHMPWVGQLYHVKKFAEKQNTQQTLRALIAWWAGYFRAQGATDSESYRRFNYKFGIDVANAKLLTNKPAHELISKLQQELDKMGINYGVK